MKKTELVRKILNILVSVAVFVLGACFIYGCLSIYYTGESSPYSLESVGKAFSKIAIPVYISVAVIVIGSVYGIIFPAEGEKPKGLIRDYKAILLKLSKKKDIGSLDDEAKSLIKAERNKRKILRCVLAGVISASALIFFSFALNPNSFAPVSGDVTGSVKVAVIKTLILFAICSCFAVYYIYAVKKSILKETELIKKAENKKEIADEAGKKDYVKYIRIAVLVIAVAAIVIGLLTGGYKDVLAKAANICKECVGIG